MYADGVQKAGRIVGAALIALAFSFVLNVVSAFLGTWIGEGFLRNRAAAWLIEAAIAIPVLYLALGIGDQVSGWRRWLLAVVLGGIRFYGHFAAGALVGYLWYHRQAHGDVTEASQVP